MVEKELTAEEIRKMQCENFKTYIIAKMSSYAIILNSLPDEQQKEVRKQLNLIPINKTMRELSDGLFLINKIFQNNSSI